jgi:hypothetical protein
VLGLGALGFVLSKDLSRWMRPVAFLVFAAVIVPIVMLVVGAGGNPILSLIIYGLSAHHDQLQLPPQARGRGRRRVARDRHFRLDRQHLHLAAEPAVAALGVPGSSGP